MRVRMNDFIDAYTVLGVAPSVDHAGLKAAYRRLAARHHPDVVADDQRAAATARMQRINIAYGLVADPARRRAYDRVRDTRQAHDGATDLDEAWATLLRAAGRWVGRQRAQSKGGFYRAGYAVGRWLRG